MHYFGRAILVVVASFHLWACADAQNQETGSEGVSSQGKFLKSIQPVTGRYIVVLDQSRIVETSMSKSSAALVARYGGEVIDVYEHALKGFSVRMTEEQASALSQDVTVKYVQEDGVTSINSVQGAAPWGLDRIDQPMLPRNTVYGYYPNGGSGVHVYVMDTGVRTTHVEFAGRIGNGISVAEDRNASVEDCFGHGTHVAATIAGTTYGVAKKAIIHPVRTLYCSGETPDSLLLKAIDWIYQNHIKPAVVNVSLQTGPLPAIDEAIKASVANGIVYVVAAGNDTADACTKTPARVKEAITVGATNYLDEMVNFSNYGPCVDILAPGAGILSANNTADTATTLKSGTSMASPHVAGAVALFLSENPTASPDAVLKAILGAATKGVLKNLSPGTPNILLRTPALPPSLCSLEVVPNGDLAEPALQINWDTPSSPPGSMCSYLQDGVDMGAIPCKGTYTDKQQVPGNHTLVLLPPNYTGTGECYAAFEVKPACEVSVSPSSGSIKDNTQFTVNWKSNANYCAYAKDSTGQGNIACNGTTTTTATYFGSGNHKFSLYAFMGVGFYSSCESNQISVTP